MKQLTNKFTEIKKFKLPIVFYDIVSYEQYQDYMKRAQQDIQDLNQMQQLESLELVMHFLRDEKEQQLFKQVAETVKQKHKLQQVSFDTHSSGEIQDGIKYVLDAIGTLDQLKMFEYRNFRGQGEDPYNQKVIKNTLIQLEELENLVFGFQHGKFGDDVLNLFYIAKGIQTLKKLQKLDLCFFMDNLPHSPQGIDILGQSLSELNELQEFRFRLYGNKFGDYKKGLESLGQMMGQLPNNLQFLQLDLEYNNITYGIDNQNDLQIINDGILQLKNLENLDLKLNLKGNINKSKLEIQELQQLMLGELKDKVKNLEIVL